MSASASFSDRGSRSWSCEIAVLTWTPRLSRSCAHPLAFSRCFLDRSVDSLIPGTPAQVPRKPDTDFFERWTRPERNSRQNHPRRADAALGSALGDESFLQHVLAAQPLDRRDARTLNLHERDETRID